MVIATHFKANAIATMGIMATNVSTSTALISVTYTESATQQQVYVIAPNIMTVFRAWSPYVPVSITALGLTDTVTLQLEIARATRLGSSPTVNLQLAH